MHARTQSTHLREAEEAADAEGGGGGGPGDEGAAGVDDPVHKARVLVLKLVRRVEGHDGAHGVPCVVWGRVRGLLLSWRMMIRYGWEMDDWWIKRRTEDEAGERLKGPALVEHELLEVADEEAELLDVALEPAREPVAPVVLPKHCVPNGWVRRTMVWDGKSHTHHAGGDVQVPAAAIDVTLAPHASLPNHPTHPRSPPW